MIHIRYQVVNCRGL